MNYIKTILAGIAILVVLQVKSQAAVLTLTFPEVDGGNGLIGDFEFTLPMDEMVTAATFSGTFGNSTNPTSGALTLDIDGVLVAECIQNDTCWFEGESFSYDFSMSEILSGIFDDGVATLTQNATAGVTRLGSLTLVLTTDTTETPVPAPGLIFMVLGGLGFLSLRKK